MVATSAGRVSRTLTLTRSRNVAPASSSTRLMLTTTLPNCASKVAGSARLSSKPGMPEMNSRSPTRAANESGGALTPAGGGKCWIGDIGHLYAQWSTVPLEARTRDPTRSSCPFIRPSAGRGNVEPGIGVLTDLVAQGAHGKAEHARGVGAVTVAPRQRLQHEFALDRLDGGADQHRHDFATGKGLRIRRRKLRCLGKGILGHSTSSRSTLAPEHGTEASGINGPQPPRNGRLKWLMKS